MIKNSLAARFVLLVLAIAAVGQLVLGVNFVLELKRRAQDSVRLQLDLAERLVVNRVAQTRSEGAFGVLQAARDPVLARAYASKASDVLQGLLSSQARKAQASRALLVRSGGGVIVDIGTEGAIAPVRNDYWGEALSTSFAVGRGSGVVAAGGSTVLWVAVPLGSEPSVAAVFIYPIESILLSEFSRATLPAQLRFQSLSRASERRAESPLSHQRRVLLAVTDGDSTSVELQVPAVSVLALLRQSAVIWLPMFFGVLAVSALAAVVLSRYSLMPLQQFNAALAALSAGNLRPIAGDFQRGELGALALTFDGLSKQIQEREQRIVRTAYRDPLTSLPNRLLYLERLTEALLDARKIRRHLAVLLIGRQQFEGISDSLGAAAADSLLVTISERLRATLREADSLIELSPGRSGNPTLARFGGDDFAIALPGCELTQARQVADRINEVLREPISHEGRRIQCRMVIGLAVYPEHAEDAEALMRAAVVAVRVARSTGESVAVYDSALARERELQTAMVLELQRALESGGMSLRFQPKIHLAGEPRLMVECLLRWNHPERGLINPEEFVPVAERTGLITHLSRWVIDQSLIQCAEWRGQGQQIQVGVNVSAQDLRTGDFATFVVERLRHHQLPAEALTIEISEGALAERSADVLVNLQVLNSLGVKLGIDDFGAGYGSLDYLRSLPVNNVKIDRRFVSKMEVDPSARLIVSSAIELAHSLQWLAVAEGVEDAATLNALRGMGCDFAQGYYFGKPLTATDFGSWLRHQSRRFTAVVSDTSAAGTSASTGSDAVPPQLPVGV